MKNLLALIGLLVVVVGGVGWYAGWYRIQVGRTVTGTLQIQTDVDTKKVGDDLSQFGQKAGALINDKTGTPPADVKVGTPVATPGPLSTPNGLTTPAPQAPAVQTPAATEPKKGGGFFSTIGRILDDRNER